MHQHSDVRKLPYTAMQMFKLVKDVEAYPEFLPWCEGLRITKKIDDRIVADMLIGFKGMSEKFTSIVDFDAENKTVVVTYKDGPFKSLINNWHFIDVEGGCEVHFDIAFEFKNKMFDIMLSPIFSNIVEKMIEAFLGRANNLYSTYNVEF